jgi:hypothetical protein
MIVKRTAQGYRQKSYFEKWNIYSKWMAQNKSYREVNIMRRFLIIPGRNIDAS